MHEAVLQNAKHQLNGNRQAIRSIGRCQKLVVRTMSKEGGISMDAEQKAEESSVARAGKSLRLGVGGNRLKEDNWRVLSMFGHAQT